MRLLRTMMAVWMPSPVRGSMWPAASPMISRWSSKDVRRPCDPSRRLAAFIRSIFAVGPSAALMNGSFLMASLCSRARSDSYVEMTRVVHASMLQLYRTGVPHS